MKEHTNRYIKNEQRKLAWDKEREGKEERGLREREPERETVGIKRRERREDKRRNLEESHA